MRISTLIAVLLVMTAANCLPASAQQRWAAIDPNQDLSAPVVWWNTEAGTRQSAIDACKRVSQSCAASPASTDNANHIFAAMCCQRPRLGCAIGGGETREEALKGVRKTFADAGYSNCTLRHYLSAGTGRKL
jgi:hypothetical protein